MRSSRSPGLWIATALLLVASIVLASLSRVVDSYAGALYAGGFLTLFAAAIVGYKAYSRPTK
ncbi:hypothetical protein ACF3NT_08700 [Naumannella halotolerans]|uniref:Uncharacterized protein n=1 Tax=Naumannella halotolerans TaxID=993414 RepID=A0A4R7J9Y4_9ACTN|nr:hypothetical protein [Naumannella halotolerans]TDT34114.1 hypothetical protein CLV29_1767 [Naumannella halotolerans]